jgi:hypothetical protein
MRGAQAGREIAKFFFLKAIFSEKERKNGFVLECFRFISLYQYSLLKDIS